MTARTSCKSEGIEGINNFTLSTPANTYRTFPDGLAALLEPPQQLPLLLVIIFIRSRSRIQGNQELNSTRAQAQHVILERSCYCRVLAPECPLPARSLANKRACTEEIALFGAAAVSL